ncbi:MAG: EAL domain-containing response regulator [Pseudolabrys sp.]|nr:EAL domain-containing response regulator [Pseudolabrys sp.]
MTAAPSSQTAPSVAPETPAKQAAPLCWIVDEDASLRHFLSLVLHGSGVDTLEFAEGGQMRAEIGKRAPTLVFHNISLESSDAIDSVVALGKAGFRGAAQLMSNRGSAVLEHVKTIGQQHKLNMLPVLKKPFGTDDVVKIIAGLKLGIQQEAAAARIDLGEALNNNWVEFWYQPKIDLRRKQLAGVEAFARARHPQHGILLPGAFMPGASEADVMKLSELAILSALKAGKNFSKLGINPRMAVNIPVEALTKLPVADIVKTQREPTEKWPGLIIDIPEDQIITDLPLAEMLTKKFADSNVRLAVDDFGRGYSAMAKVKELPFAELKLDRTFVTDCGTDKTKAPLCKTVIDLAHNFGSTVVGVGIEKAADAVALISMGCDYGQGFLMGQPMPEERFVSLLRQRAGNTAAAAPAA